MFAQIVADELGVPFEDVEVTTGDTRRIRVRRRHVRLAGRGDERQRGRAWPPAQVRAKALRIAADALEADAGRPRDRRRRRARSRARPATSIALGTVAVLSNPLRYAFDEASKAGHPVRRSATRTSRRSPRTTSRGWRARDFYSPDRGRRSPPACTRRSSRPTRETAEITILRTAVVHDCGTLINPMIVEGQIHGGVAQGVGGALYERMAYDEPASCSTPRSWTS